MLFRSPKPQTPNPKPQTPNPGGGVLVGLIIKVQSCSSRSMSVSWDREAEGEWRKQRISTRFKEIKENLNELERQLHIRGNTPDSIGRGQYKTSSPTRRPQNYPDNHYLQKNVTGFRNHQTKISHHKYPDLSFSTEMNSTAYTKRSAAMYQNQTTLPQFDLFSTRSHSQWSGTSHQTKLSPSPLRSISPIKQLEMYCSENFSKQASVRGRSREGRYEPPGDLLSVCRLRRDWLKDELASAQSKLRREEATTRAQVEVERVFGHANNKPNWDTWVGTHQTRVEDSQWKGNYQSELNGISGRNATPESTHPAPISNKDKLKQQLNRLNLRESHSNVDLGDLAESDEQLGAQLLTYEQLIQENLRLKEMLVQAQSGKVSTNVTRGSVRK